MRYDVMLSLMLRKNRAYGKANGALHCLSGGKWSNKPTLRTRTQRQGFRKGNEIRWYAFPYVEEKSRLSQSKWCFTLFEWREVK
ncbi:hypothetical protein [Commensalibacter sp. Nvir]|uniref:hypothetical protein n=1 Tax=Commensalibacter sp. Nvir TaxID=3069817 RepID=UPI0030C89B0C